MRTKVKRIAAKLGAEIETIDTEDGKEIQVAAPDGKVWSDGPGVLLAHYGGTWGPASDAWKDLAERMEGGLSDE